MPYFQKTLKKKDDTDESVKVKFAKPDGYPAWKKVNFKEHADKIRVTYEEGQRRVIVKMKVEELGEDNELGGFVDIPQTGEIDHAPNKMEVTDLESSSFKVRLHKKKPFSLESIYTG